MRSKTRVAIVTGFLGSGKTTLVREILAQSAKRKVRTAALVNDIAEINVDRELLQISDPSHPAAIDGDGNHGQSSDVLGGRKKRVELADGCVCCSIKDDLMEAAVSVFPGIHRGAFAIALGMIQHAVQQGNANLNTCFHPL